MSKRALEKIDSRKLTKILNLLDSSSDGEVVAAAKSAVHYLRQRGFTWKDLLEDREPVNHPLRGGAGWVKLQDPVVIKRTEKAALVSVHLTHGRIEEIWFPRSTLRETGDTVLVTQWIVDKKERELQAAGIFEQIQGDPV